MHWTVGGGALLRPKTISPPALARRPKRHGVGPLLDGCPSHIVGTCTTSPRGLTESSDYVRRFWTGPGQSLGLVREAVRNPVSDRDHVQGVVEHNGTNRAVASAVLRDLLIWANETSRILLIRYLRCKCCSPVGHFLIGRIFSALVAEGNTRKRSFRCS